MDGATRLFKLVQDFVRHLRWLREQRLERKLSLRSNAAARPSLSPNQRDMIYRKTGGFCHLCGGELTGKWTADHVSPCALGGEHSADNYLPAHRLCNHAKWFYGPEEFQWIMKLGVYFRTELEENENENAIALAEGFLRKERRNSYRRKNKEPGL